MSTDSAKLLEEKLQKIKSENALLRRAVTPPQGVNNHTEVFILMEGARYSLFVPAGVEYPKVNKALMRLSAVISQLETNSEKQAQDAEALKAKVAAEKKAEEAKEKEPVPIVDSSNDIEEAIIEELPISEKEGNASEKDAPS